MRRYISKLFTYILNPGKVKLLLCLMKGGYLYERGWLNSMQKNKIIGNEDQPLPWISYPAIDFLEKYLPPGANIFEYGGGFSTAYYCKRYNTVTTVEHDAEWCKKIAGMTNEFTNCTILFKENKLDYINAIGTQQKLFDLIIIDGAWRNDCLLRSIEYLSDKGILLLDDSDRLEYKDTIQHVKNSGFIAIPFIGMKPRSYEQHNTTIFFRR